MANKLLRAIAVLPNESGLSEDQCVNTFHFDGDSGNTDSEYFGAVNSMLTAFYQALQTRLSDHILSPVHVKVYDMRDAIPRVEVYSFDITITRTSIDGLLPNEVALCLSYQADPVSGTPQARLRGRIYVGPFCSTGNVTDAVGELHPSSALISALAAAGHGLASPHSLGTTGSMRWAVYSPTLDIGGTLDDAFNDITNGWVDNAWDTQRRRGRKPSARTTYTD